MSTLNKSEGHPDKESCDAEDLTNNVTSCVSVDFPAVM